VTLSDSLRDDVTAIFLQDDDFAEPILYILRNGGSRSILAIVDREPPAFYDPTGNVVLPMFTIEIADTCDITKGVSKALIDTGGDNVELLAEHGDVTKTRLTVLQVIESDFNGMIKLALK